MVGEASPATETFQNNRTLRVACQGLTDGVPAAQPRTAQVDGGATTHPAIDLTDRYCGLTATTVKNARFASGAPFLTQAQSLRASAAGVALRRT